MSRRELLRASVLSAVLLPGLVYLALYAYIVVWTGMTVGQALPRIPICLLVLLALLNAVLRGPLAKLRLSTGELRLIYALCGVGLAGCGVGYALSIVPTLGGGLLYYADAGRKEWADYLQHVPDWAMLHDAAIVRRFYLGHSTLYRADHLRALAVPLVGWTAFCTLLIVGQACLTELLREQWLRRERLTFPLAALPLQMTAGPRFWRQRAMWFGLGVAAFINLVNGLSFLYPGLPEIRVKVIRLAEPTVPPWTGLGRMQLTFYPFVIGIGYLLSSDVSLSLWLFHLLAKLQMVAAVAFGFRADGSFPSPTAPYLEPQGAGAFVVFGVMALWRLRGAERPRGALAGVLLCGAGVVWFGLAAGVPPVLMVAWVVVSLVMGVAVARLVGEAGTPLAMTPVYPQQFLYQTLGASFGPRDWGRFCLFRNPDELYTDYAPVHMLTGHRLVEERRPWLTALFAAFTWLGLIAGMWALCDMYFRHGVMNVKATWPDRTQAQNPWLQLDLWLNGGVPAGQARASLIGAGVAAALTALRLRVLWWPIHPIGYAVCGTYAIQQLYVPLLIAWVWKTFTLRAGGLRLYRAMLPFALGLILGDILVPQFWTIVGVILDRPMYFAFPS